MALFQLTDPTHVTARRDAMRRKLVMQHTKMRELDPLRYLDAQALEAEIWRHVAENVPRETVLDNSVNSVTNTLKGFLTGRRPTITVTAKNPISQVQEETADKTERMGYALFDTINRERSTALEDDVVDHAVHRGVIIIQTLWLSPEERGEEIVEVASDLPATLTEGVVPLKVVRDEGAFAVLVKVLDPLDCYWELDDATGKVVEFVHEYKLSVAALARRYPGTQEQAWFRDHYTLTPESAEATVTVTDYWDDEVNAILIDNTHWLKKPTPHDYECLPVVIELVDPEIRREYVDGMSVREGVPFCHNIRPYAMGYSRMMSYTETYLKCGAFASYVLSGIDPNNTQRFQRDDATNADGTMGVGIPEFIFNLNFSPFGDVIPLFLQEKLELVPVAQLVPTLEALKAFYDQAKAKGSFNEGILTGMFPAEPPSGMSVVRMQMATTARMKPVRKAAARALGRALYLVCRMFATNWDRGPDGQVVLAALSGQSADQYEELTFTEDDFGMVSSIYVDINPDVELDKEQRDMNVMQQVTSGLLSRRRAIQLLGNVQDANAEVLDIALDQESMTNPQVRASLAMQSLRQRGIPMVQPNPMQAGAPQPGAPAPPGAASPAPVPPPSPGGAPLAPDQAAPPPQGGLDLMALLQQLPPDAQAALMQMMQGGGPPPTGGPLG